MSPVLVAIDTSVFAAATLRHEVAHQVADRLMHMLAQDQTKIAVPSILIPEIMSALQRNKYPLPRIRQLVLAYRSPHLMIVPVDLQLADEAGEIAILQGTKGSDSIFLALARSLTVPLLTLDREQQDRAPADIEVFTPEQALAKWWPS
jgi:predicted nucleic acid-binding protein